MATARDRLTSQTPKNIKADLCTNSMNSNLKIKSVDLTATGTVTFVPYEADVYIVDPGGSPAPVLAASGTFPDGYRYI